ncbi:aminotransferase class V-fold PLP-dependent enzyme [Mucisphaera sp.]|uniref:aminotransferase class V-fold PLP-dependent enzyme n=1 Tax=Mucisphaera sp. TaxID=2913024 RepID=UPI003D13653D
MNQRIYMDNAATSFPKPPAVAEAMTRFATEIGASPGRGAYTEAQEAGALLNLCRERINQLIHGENPNHVIFTLNTSDALNLGIRGLVRPGDHVVTTWMDHNSVLRPLNKLVDDAGVEQTRVECDPTSGVVDPDDIRQAIQKNTRLVAVVHGSNVTGTVQPIAEIGKVCREMAVPLLVDAAQTIGHLPIDVQRDCIDLLAFPGHKGLLGPLGTGGLYIRPGLEKQLQTVREGGTGSVSELDVQPDFMPDKYEPGSHNAIGLIGLSEGVGWILSKGIDKLWAHEQGLVKVMLEGLTSAESAGVHLYGPPGVANRCGVFSIRIDGYVSPVDLSNDLEERFGILTRSGIHCAPLAHATVGTHDLGGTTRLSFGPFLSNQEVKYACDALFELAEAKASITA